MGHRKRMLLSVTSGDREAMRGRFGKVAAGEGKCGTAKRHKRVEKKVEEPVAVEEAPGDDKMQVDDPERKDSVVAIDLEKLPPPGSPEVHPAPVPAARKPAAVPPKPVPSPRHNVPPPTAPKPKIPVPSASASSPLSKQRSLQQQQQQQAKKKPIAATGTVSSAGSGSSSSDDQKKTSSSSSVVTSGTGTTGRKKKAAPPPPLSVAAGGAKSKIPVPQQQQQQQQQQGSKRTRAIPATAGGPPADILASYLTYKVKVLKFNRKR